MKFEFCDLIFVWDLKFVIWCLYLLILLLTENFINKLVFTSLLLFFLAGCQLNNITQPPTNQPTACTMEAKLCPDGSAVGRSGPNCEFAPCPGKQNPAEPQNTSSGLQEPIKDFQSRITKKFFGAYITPENSLIQPERFTGYHTGADVEYEDATEDVPVWAIAGGEVMYSSWTSGYGGTVVISHLINGEMVLAIYGHLNPDSMIKKGEKIKAGQQIGTLGQGNTKQTDYERKHLHFALYRGTDINLRGYVSDEKLLEQWLDPLLILPVE